MRSLRAVAVPDQRDVETGAGKGPDACERDAGLAGTAERGAPDGDRDHAALTDRRSGQRERARDGACGDGAVHARDRTRAGAGHDARFEPARDGRPNGNREHDATVHKAGAQAYKESVAKSATVDSSKHSFDPGALADRQLTLDRDRTKRFPDLFVRKLQRMSASPLAYLRGAAPLFFEILAAHPDLAEGPGGEGWIVGDMHLENIGAYRPDPLGVAEPASSRGASPKKRVVKFDLNDFDDAIIGPWRLDVLRVATSLLLGGRELGASGLVALDLCDRLLEAWARSAFDGAPVPEAPAPVAALVEQVRARSKTALLDARTEVVGGKRRFVRGPRYAELPAEVVHAVPAAFEQYIAGLPEEDKPHKGSVEIVDCALRIAGTGSLGGLRIGVLVKGKGGLDGGWIFDMKEQGDPSASTILGVPSMVPAERVCTAFHACVQGAPRMMGHTVLRGSGGASKLSMFVRKLSPQEDKLNLRRLKGADLPALAAAMGAVLGTAHARAATKAPKRWAASDLATIRTHAISLAGIHEAIYLELCERMRTLLPKT